jgi:cell division septation protein DedD
VLAEAEAWVSGTLGAAPPLVTRSTISELPVEDQDDAATPADTAPYSVQLGAFSNEGRAAALFDLARAADLNVRLVRMPQSNLIHVRAGRFETSIEATEFSRRVTVLGFTAAVVRDAQDEDLVRSSFRVPSHDSVH